MEDNRLKKWPLAHLGSHKGANSWFIADVFSYEMPPDRGEEMNETPPPMSLQLCLIEDSSITHGFQNINEQSTDSGNLLSLYFSTFYSGIKPGNCI